MSLFSLRNRRRRGNMIMESLLFLPFMFLLLVGTLRIGEITYYTF